MKMTSLTAYDLLNEISQYNIGNTDHIFDKKELNLRFKKMDFKEISDFLTSCDREILENIERIKTDPNCKDYKDNIHNTQIFYKQAKKIGYKILKGVLK